MILINLWFKIVRILFLLFLLGFIIVFFTVDLNIFLQKLEQWIPDNILNNFILIKKIIIPSLVFVLIFICIVGFIQKKYSIKVEQLSLGGINILLDRRKVIFLNSVRIYLDSKRTLFKIDEVYDNFSEVFQSYYETYNFLRQEMRILDPKRDKGLYDITNQMLMTLNRFLTKNQNNYLRWYKHISETNQELIKLDEFEESDSKPDQRYFYNMPIGIIQSKYYLYDELVTEFKFINQFFIDNVVEKFSIDIEKWD